MLIIGLTGGVASGKSFASSQLQRLKIPVFDADLEVHKLLANNLEIFLLVKKNFPQAIINNKIDRKILGAEVLADKEKLQNLEQIIYPHLHKQENLFLKNCRRNHRKIAVLNIPLLFEKDGYKRCHKTIALIVSKPVQFQRFKSRFPLTQGLQRDEVYKKFKNITSHQINNLQRKKQADFLIHNGLGKAFCYRQVQAIIEKCLQSAVCKPIKRFVY
ncbi:MAG: dephospho-CoA kinase [Pseudomonadota bacterium]